MLAPVVVKKDVDLAAAFRPFTDPNQIPDLTGGLGLTHKSGREFSLVGAYYGDQPELLAEFGLFMDEAMSSSRPAIRTFVPAAGSHAGVLTSASRSGAFATLTGTAIPSGGNWTVSYLTTGADLVAGP